MPLSRCACSRLAGPSQTVSGIFSKDAIGATAVSRYIVLGLGGGLGVCAALVRFAELSWRLALATLLLLPLAALTTCGARLPSAPSAAPIVVPLPDVAGDVWESRGDVVHQEPYDDAPLEDRDAVLGQAWRAVYTSVSGVDGGRR